MNPTISIITPTLNVAGVLPRLIESLRAQTDHDFRFIVIDGNSKDGTQAELIAASDIVTLMLTDQSDGFYDALNMGIRSLETDYYLVVGADDTLHPDAIANFKAAACETGSDVIVAGVEAGKSVRRGYHGSRGWLGHAAMVTSHSVGMLFRTELHQRFGEYSRRYPVLADGLFIKRVCQAPDVKVSEAGFVAGKFGLAGLSNRNVVNVLCETWQIQIDTGENPILQYLLFQLRLVRYLPQIIRKCA
jgi:glycosyltransferase involved in cell wall biosynthesis